EDIRRGNVEPAIVDDKGAFALDLCLAGAEGRENAADDVHILGVAEFEAGADDAGEVANILGHEEIALHEALDAEHAQSLLITHATRQIWLYVEGEFFVGAPGQEVEMAA